MYIHTVWKFKNFSALNFLREINFDVILSSDFRNSGFDFAIISAFKKCTNSSNQFSGLNFFKIAIFEPLLKLEIDFTENMSSGKIGNFSHCVLP